MSKIINNVSMEKMAGGLEGLLNAVENKAKTFKGATGFSVPKLSKDIGVGKNIVFKFSLNPSKGSVYFGVKKGL